MGSFYEPGPLGTVRVAAFSGRKNTEYGIWGDIARQLDRQDVFNNLYLPLQAPAVAVFLFLAALDHLRMAAPGVNRWYTGMTDQYRNNTAHEGGPPVDS